MNRGRPRSCKPSPPNYASNGLRTTRLIPMPTFHRSDSIRQRQTTCVDILLFSSKTTNGHQGLRHNIAAVPFSILRTLDTHNQYGVKSRTKTRNPLLHKALADLVFHPKLVCNHRNEFGIYGDETTGWAEWWQRELTTKVLTVPGFSWVPPNFFLPVCFPHYRAEFMGIPLLEFIAKEADKFNDSISLST